MERKKSKTGVRRLSTIRDEHMERRFEWAVDSESVGMRVDKDISG